MDVACPSCRARYRTNAEKLRGKTARMRCRACETVWLITGPKATATERAAPPSSRSAGGAPPSSRPPSRAPISHAPSSHAPSSRAPISRAPSSRAPISRAPISHVSNGPHAPHAPISSASPSGSVTVAVTPSETPAVVPNPPRSAPRSAPRDLLTNRPVEFAPSSSHTIRPPPVSARGESSVLFTVESLRAAERLRSSSPPPPPREEDGVIDLLATISPAPPPRPVPREVFASDAPPPAYARSLAPGPGRPPSLVGTLGAKTVAALAAAAVATITLCSAALVAAFGSDEPSAASATLLPAPNHKPTPSSSLAILDGREKARPQAAETVAPSKRGRGKTRAFVGAARSSAPAEPAAPKAVKPADPCHCKGNFDCIMRCAVKGKT